MSEELIEKRRSIRAFRSTPVARPLLEEILGRAALTPSWTNTQPWEVIMVEGGKLAELGEAFCRSGWLWAMPTRRPRTTASAASGSRWPPS